MTSDGLFNIREKESVSVEMRYQTMRAPGESRVRHLLVMEGVSLDTHLTALFDHMAHLLLSPDFSDLETLSKILKYHSADMV